MSYRTFIKDGNLLLSLGMGARERHRFIWHYLQAQTNLFYTNGIKLLHISPEYCFYKKLKDKINIQYIPVDKFEPGYDYFSLTKDFDLLEPSLLPEQYDFIICNHVLEHIIDDKTAISNLFKVLKIGGTAIVSVPILVQNAPTYENYSIVTPKERKKHFGQWDHVRHYGTDIENRFTDAGFEVKTINSENYFSIDERIKFGVPHETFLFHLIKK
ncbi:MAG TPA: methyltransferase domain-containing protein [Aequorivita sp.]|nr:methyltransferase domain-containing protein [Aequorivita sp.]